MGYNIRQIDSERKFCDQLSLDVLSKVAPLELIHSVLRDANADHIRHRKLSMAAVVLLLISMNLYSHLSISHVLKKLFAGLRFIWPDPDMVVPKHNAISYRRYQLGARPLVDLFHRVAKPIATPQTVGAFAFGLRLMAIDGTIEDLPDTPENTAAFGRLHSDRGKGGFPQLRGVYLVECGTHAIVDAGFWPCRTSERIGGFRLLRSVESGMLVMWDRGFHDFDMLAGVGRRDAQVLSRLPAYVKPEPVSTLADGTWLAWIKPSDFKRRKRGEKLMVRIISYTLTDPTQAGYGERHRLVTTLLDERKYPAIELVCLYHERWEVELVIDEVDTHQRLVGRPLRSLKPVGVIQELYSLLIAHFAVRSLMHEAAAGTGIDPDRISFIGALRIIQDAVPEFQMVSEEQMPRLYARLLRDIACEILPQRRARTNPRVVKRKMSGFNLKREQHYNWPQPIVAFRQTVMLI